MSMQVTEDTPPDMLAGSMDLKVVLPDGQSMKMSVQRGTPMMDLLVQVTTAHCLSPGDYSLQPMGDKGVLPFKPSTPIGALDAFTVKIVEKKLNSRGRAPQVPQSFLNTFRLQVYLPRSQLFVLRVTPDVTLSEIMTHICTEKNLNIDKYEFRNPGNLDEILELDKTLGYYKLQELSMMSKGNRTVTGLMSSADIINVKSSKHRQNSVCDSSLSSGSFGSRSGSPIPAINVVMPPQPPIRKKRRPAPKPPTFTENEKKDKTNGSVLISHSRESSDSSGYHEASVLSESPTHGSPAGRLDGDSPPDTLPRRSKLPPSQSFTNLTSIQPAPKPRLTSSVSNTSLNSTGHRKKRAPPPPPTVTPREDKIKSSTLPTSVTEERRNGSTFASENTFRHYSPVEASDTKVQIPVESTSVVNETKACKDEVPASLDVDVRVPPKPKPRTSVPKTPPKCSVQTKAKDLLQTQTGTNRWKNFENLAEEPIKKEEDGGKVPGSTEAGQSRADNVDEKPRDGGLETVKKSLLVGYSGICENVSREEAQVETDQDSINWEYQLPPPPTDFRDANSPDCTEFGTVTITPEVFENVASPKKKVEETFRKQWPEEETIGRARKESVVNAQTDDRGDKKFSRNKTEVMNELTNILCGSGRKSKEKSLSVSNLYIESDPRDCKKNALNYSRSFSVEPVSGLDNFKLTTYQSDLNNRWSTSAVRDSDVKYRNSRNLEKSSSMECIDGRSNLIEKSEDVFRKPVAPVQKKLKVAKRSASSAGVAHKRNTIEVAQGEWPDDENMDLLREQFLEFLKEKKLKSDLNMKSLDVIRNILPEFKSEKREEKEAKAVEVKVKSPEPETKRESPKRNPEVAKRYSYQGPPSINFATWGERPKSTKIVIKDEDYVTQDKVPAKKETKVEEAAKPKEVKKPAQIVIKKPGVLSRYEMFSALPRRKEASSLELVQREDEERKKSKELHRVPVVCGMELKKDVKPPVPEFPVRERPRHSVSVYVNGNEEAHGVSPSYSFVVPKRNSALMPVVKGFRTLEEKTSQVSSSPSNHVNINISSKAEVTSPERQVNGTVPPPPPPSISLIRLKPVSSGVVKQTPVSVDPRSQLLDEIRNFGGLRKLKKSAFHQGH